MKGLVLRSFVDAGVNACEGEVIDLPEGVDWVQAGLVRPLGEQAAETAAVEPAEKAVRKVARPRTARARKPKDG